jgi:BirA family biotin operon repressor/biotin-[acetyl-CoA-carboxylase] ligase
MQRVHFDSTDSTNAQARLLAAERAGERLLVTAATQTAGRGRHGRIWHSPRGGAWLSLVWTRVGEPQAYVETSLVAAEAVRAALIAVAPELRDRLAIKWPNDILVAGRKVAGILCEQCPAPSPGVMIIGVGVNVDFDVAQLGDDLRTPPTTLSCELARRLEVEPVIAAVAESLVKAMTAFEANRLSAAEVSLARNS